MAYSLIGVRSIETVLALVHAANVAHDGVALKDRSFRGLQDGDLAEGVHGKEALSKGSLATVTSI